MKDKRVKPTQARLFDPREKSNYREAFRGVPKQETSYQKEYYAKNRERILANQRANYKKKKTAEKARAYYAEHREHLCAIQRKNYKKRMRRNKLSQSRFGRLRLRIETLFDWSQTKRGKRTWF